MDDQDTKQPEQVVPKVEPPAASAQAVTDEPLPEGMSLAGNGKVQVLSTAAYKRLRDESKIKGKREAMAELEQRAKQFGYGSVEAMYAALEGLKAGQLPPAPKAQPRQQHRSATPAVDEAAAPQYQQASGRNDRRDAERIAKERDRYQKQLDQVQRRARHEEKRRRELQHQLEAKEAEQALQLAAVRAGVRDVDYSIRLLTRELEGKSETDLAKFDEAKFFADLRETHPYLYGESVKPATTGVGIGGSPPPPKPGQAAQSMAANGQVDARKMTAEEFNEHLRKRGLSRPMV